MDELRRGGDKKRVGFEPQLEAESNVKVVRAFIPVYDHDIEKLKAQSYGSSWHRSRRPVRRSCHTPRR